MVYSLRPINQVYLFYMKRLNYLKNPDKLKNFKALKLPIPTKNYKNFGHNKKSSSM